MLLHGVPRYELVEGEVRQLGWTSPPISAQELQAWAAFERVSGPMLLHERLDVAAGIIAMTIAAANSTGKRELELSDFMPRWDAQVEQARRQTPEQVMSLLDALAKKGERASEVHPEPPDAPGVAARPRGRRDDAPHRRGR